MRWIKTGKQFSVAVKNGRRLREILSVFAKYGFADFIDRMNLSRFLPASWTGEESASPERIKKAFEELGPTFVKLGQILSSRPDLLPEEYIEELKKLQDGVQQISFDEIKSIVELELGKTLEQAFLRFDESPIAAASIAQVHTATLHTGESVVVKVQRPGIQKLIKQDIALLEFLAALLEKNVPESRILSPKIFVNEFFRTLTQEMNFFVEANNIERFAENVKEFPGVTTPKVFKSHSTMRVLTLERFVGTPLNQIENLKAKGFDLKKINELGARVFFKTVHKDGFFHGDLHGGNIFILDDGRLGFIDFGIVGRLSPKSRSRLSNMIMALLDEDFETLCYQYAELGSSASSVDFESFQREVRNTLGPYMGLKIGEVNSGQILIEATKVATKYHIHIPGDWMLVFKAIFTMEGMGQALDPEFDSIKLGQELIKDMVKSQLDITQALKSALWVSKDFLALIEMLPRHLRWAVKKWSKDGYAFELRLPQLDQIQESLDEQTRKTSNSILSGALFIASAISLQYSNGDHQVYGYPLISVIFFVLALFFWWKR